MCIGSESELRRTSIDDILITINNDIGCKSREVDLVKIFPSDLGFEGSVVSVGELYSRAIQKGLQRPPAEILFRVWPSVQEKTMVLGCLYNYWESRVGPVELFVISRGPSQIMIKKTVRDECGNLTFSYGSYVKEDEFVVFEKPK